VMMLGLPVRTRIDDIVGFHTGLHLSCHGVQFGVDAVSLTSGMRPDFCSGRCNLLTRLPTCSPCGHRTPDAHRCEAPRSPGVHAAVNDWRCAPAWRPDAR
jgi:hypothetical protein